MILGFLKGLKLTAVYFLTSGASSHVYPTRFFKIAVCSEFNTISLSNIPPIYLTCLTQQVPPLVCPDNPEHCPTEREKKNIGYNKIEIVTISFTNNACILMTESSKIRDSVTQPLPLYRESPQKVFRHPELHLIIGT